MTPWLQMGSILLGVLSIGCAQDQERGARLALAAAPASSVPAAAQLGAPPLEHAGGDRVAFQPSDMSTAVFNSVPGALLAEHRLSPEERDRLAARLELVTWPERELVEASREFPEGDMGEDGSVRMIFVPAVPLTDRWYAIRGTLPAGFLPAEDLARDREGRWVSRFRIGHQPLVRATHVVAADDGSVEIRVSYSERIRAAEATDLWRLEAAGTVWACTTLNDEELVSEGGTNVLRLSCGEIVDGAHVRLVPGPTTPISLAGHALSDPAGGELGAIELDIVLPPPRARPVRDPLQPHVVASNTARLAGRSVSSFGL